MVRHALAQRVLLQDVFLGDLYHALDQCTVHATVRQVKEERLI